MEKANQLSSFSVSLESTEPILQTLRARGWSLVETGQVKALIVIQTALSDPDDSLSVADSVESELLNTDLRSIGSNSLPDPASFLSRKTSYLHGPKVLQICSVRNVSLSREEGFAGLGDRRLLRFVLTDGKREIVAIEYSPIPSIPSDVVPGAKVRLENKAPIHSGILCLNAKVITLLGGVVQSLQEEWQMNRRYSGILRSSLRQSQETESGGPPPFEKLHIGASPSSHWSSQQGRSSEKKKTTFAVYPGSTSKGSVPAPAHTAGSVGNRQIGTDKTQDNGKAASFRDEGSTTSIGDEGKAASIGESAEKNPSETRPKEVAEAVPVQNQEAAQKLLQKMSQTTHSGQRSRSQKQRGKEKQEQEVFTLDEWEKRNAGEKSQLVIKLSDTSQDEDLARQLQNQLDIEDYHVQGRTNTVADDIRLSMFNFGRDADNGQGMELGGRGGGMRGWRGRGRGRGRGKWKGRGRFG